MPRRFPIAKLGLIFTLPFFLLSFLSLFFRLWPLFIIFLFVITSLLFFFRDPERKIIASPNILLAPADGRILEIKNEETRQNISIFLSLLDVHLVRSPLPGVIIKVEDKIGKKLPAYKNEASRLNQAKTLIIQNQGESLELRMIVGVAARRIHCFVQPGDKVVAGERIGLMAFGSRVELSFPLDYMVKAELKQKVKAGLSVLAERKQG